MARQGKGTKMVKRVLVDIGALIDVLYFDAFEQIGLTLSKLRPFLGKFIAFSGEELAPCAFRIQDLDGNIFHKTWNLQKQK